MPYYIGKYAEINIDGVIMPFDKWSINIKKDAIESTSFKSNGIREFVSGQSSGDITVSGFVDSTISNSDFANPAQIRLSMSATDNNGFVALVVITNISFELETRGPARVNITGTVTGEITATI